MPQFYVGVLGAYVSAQVPTVGRIIQGVLLAYVYVVVTCDAWLGLVPEEVMDFLEWVLLAAVTGAGILLGSLNVLMPNVMNVIASSSIGIFMSMQIFCVLGCADLEQVPKLGLEWFVLTGRTVAGYSWAGTSPSRSRSSRWSSASRAAAPLAAG